MALMASSSVTSSSAVPRKEVSRRSISRAVPQSALPRGAGQRDIEAQRQKRDEIDAEKSHWRLRVGAATGFDVAVKIHAHGAKRGWHIRPAEFYRRHDSKIKPFGYYC